MAKTRRTLFCNMMIVKTVLLVYFVAVAYIQYSMCLNASLTNQLFILPPSLVVSLEELSRLMQTI